MGTVEDDRVADRLCANRGVLSARLTARALFGPAREAPAGVGVAGQLAAFLGRVG